jgi:hypothetical protein
LDARVLDTSILDTLLSWLRLGYTLARAIAHYLTNQHLPTFSTT